MPKPGGARGERGLELVLEGATYFFEPVTEAKTLGTSAFRGTTGGFADPLTALLRLRGGGLSITGGRGGFESLNWDIIALCPAICLLTASAARLRRCGSFPSGEADVARGRLSGELRCCLGISFCCL